MKRLQRFTLIEIMVVMALAALLAAIAMPAFSALMNGSSVGTTCGRIKNTLDIAQARALTERQYVATVFDLDGSVSGLSDMQAMRNCYVSSGYAFLGWVEDSSWVKLDQGAQMLVFALGETGSSPSFPTASASPNTSVLQTVTGVSDAKTASLPAVVYAAYGNVKSPNNNFYIGVGEASLANGNYIFKSTSQDGATANRMAVTVNRFTGRTQSSAINESGKIE